MSLPLITDLDRRLSDVLSAASSAGVLIEGEDASQYALMPLDDDVLDLLIERDPGFAAHCQSIRQAMNAGQYQTHDASRKFTTS